MKKWIPISIGVLLLIFALYYVGTQFTYSRGNRAGTLIKFSQKGYMFKTYEGELNLGGINNEPNTGLINNMWDFSVNDDAAAQALMVLEGKKVRVHYKQVLKNFPWQGDTPYFVDSVTEVK